MLMPAVSSRMMMERQMLDVFNLDWLKIWKEWELRGLVILSLTCQVILITLGKRRKYIAGSWIGFIVWSTYLLADYIAAMAISLLSNGLGDVNRHGGSLDEQFVLRAFWGPFLLLHLGGTDSISAFSVEDNELWRRHALGVLSQALITAYVLLTAWQSSRLSLLSIPIFCIGLVKYSERAWVLYLSSEKKFRNSIPNTSICGSKVTEQCNLKQLEGFHLTHQVLEVEVREYSAMTETTSEVVEFISDANKLLTAYSFLEMVKGLFADVILGVHDRDASKVIFEDNQMSAGDAFKIIEIELSYIYDLIYTKAKVVFSIYGIVARIIGIFLNLSVLVMFLTLMQKQRHFKIEYNITLVLLVVALLLELVAIASLLHSDRTAHWLITHNKTTIFKVLDYFSPLAKRRRWSKILRQLSFSTEEKVHQILKKLRIDEILEIHQYETPAEFGEDLKEFIFNEIKQVRLPERNIGNATDLKALFGRRGGRTLERFNRQMELEWSVKLEFDQSIIIWHLATIIYSKIEEKEDKNDSISKIAKRLSQYMLYLLVEHPYMLRIGIGHIRFQDIQADVRNFISEVTSEESVASVIEIITSKSNFVIFNACKLALAIKNPPKGNNGNKTKEEMGGKTNETEHWRMIANVWLEMLGHAANLCGGTNHARQLRRGGELLTHVWLLMAHLGLTDHFQIERSPSIVAAVVG